MNQFHFKYWVVRKRKLNDIEPEKSVLHGKEHGMEFDRPATKAEVYFWKLIRQHGIVPDPRFQVIPDVED